MQVRQHMQPMQGSKLTLPSEMGERSKVICAGPQTRLPEFAGISHEGPA